MASSSESHITIDYARTPEQIEKAQRLRYKVFYEEHDAKADAQKLASGLDQDAYDEVATHLIVKDHEQIVGTYRLLTNEAAQKAGGFYSSNEFDLSKLVNSDLKILELGRSCVLPSHRNRLILNMMWQWISDYVINNNIDIMFGCGSLPGTNLEENAASLSYLHHFHSTEDNLNVRVLDQYYNKMDIIPKEDIDQRRAFASLPPLIKGYLRLGGSVGDGAFIDYDFSTTDVFIMVQTKLVSERYRSHYERKNDSESAVLNDTETTNTTIMG